MPITNEQLTIAAEAWIRYRLSSHPSKEDVEEFGWITEFESNLRWSDPEGLWQLILEVHRQNQSNTVMQLLSAGPIENLLAQYGDVFIERVEREARHDPRFAKLLGGVWKSHMTDEVWKRLQDVWDRRGWDGIPE